ncbi:MAG: hypothetical protein NZ656_08420, partial [Nitrospinaceae bacterium]|nr:hypothetical protein [Nitrospinaceae bacterium]
FAPSQLLFQYAGNNQHSLFSILSNASMRILGEHEVAFRFPVFIAAIISVFLIHRLGQCFGNFRVATFASILMIGSAPHLYWALYGRGYALTEMLALVNVFGAILLLGGKSPNKGAWILILSGFALCITVPSNAYFLPACGLAFLFVLWESGNLRNPVSLPRLGKKILPFIILAVLAAGYFFMIYDDLVRGIETHINFLKQFRNTDSMAGTPQKFQEVALHLARPWGFWLYLPAFYGVWALNRPQRGFILILLGTPALLVVFSGMMGPPRTYIYALPFLILLAALGIDRGIGLLSRFMPHFNKALPAALGLAFLIPSIFSHAQDYLDKKDIMYATMEESREALRYVQNQTAEHDLVVISFDDMALRRTLEPLVAEKMLHVFKDGQLDGIIFIGHRDIPINRIASVSGWPTSALPVSLMSVIADIGKLRIYRMNVKVIPLFPFEAGKNFLRRWLPLKTPKFSLTETHAHRFLGKQSLQIKKNYKKNALIFSPLVYSIPSQGGSFVLYAYAGKYQQKSEAGILGNKHNQGAFPLNYLFGVYREEGNNLAWERIHPFFMFRHSKHKESFKWRITFMLIPLNASLNKIQQALVLKDETSYFDGIHGYLLAPIVEK